jgi:ABC-type polysaccharide/polyol phosphate export permease
MSDLAPDLALLETPASSPTRRWATLAQHGIADLWSRRRLIRYMVGAEMKRTHADTVIGQVWWILDPILQVIVYFLVFGIIFQRKTPDFLLFLLSGVLPWKWFGAAIGESMGSVVARQSLIRQVPFPKIVLPVSSSLAATVSFVIGLISLVLVYLLYLHRLTVWLVFLPYIALVQFVFTLALAIVLSAANAFYRDVSNVMQHVLRLWFYMSPILYTVDDLPKNPIIHFVFLLNPFTTILGAYHSVIWGTAEGPPTGPPDMVALTVVLAISSAALLVAIAAFKRVEPAFARIL